MLCQLSLKSVSSITIEKRSTEHSMYIVDIGKVFMSDTIDLDAEAGTGKHGRRHELRI